MARTNQPRVVSVVVDNDSWIIPYAKGLVTELTDLGDDAAFCRTYEEIRGGYAAFYLGCTRITPPEILARNTHNLVVHQSDLPKGRGFSPLTWQVLEGQNTIPVCLFEMVEKVDEGAIIYRDAMHFEGHELLEELQRASAEMSVGLCKRFMSSPEPHQTEEQRGESSWYRRRKPEDSELDPTKSLGEQFDLLRIVDNQRYPAFFRYRGHTYVLRIEKKDK